MSWIDTPLVQDVKHDLNSFTTMLARLPYPLGKTTSVDKRGEAFVKGIEGRKRRINVPGWVGAFRWVKPVLSTRVGAAGRRSGSGNPARDGCRSGCARSLDQRPDREARRLSVRWS